MINYSLIEETDLLEVICMQETYLNSGDYISQSIQTAFACKNYIGYKACHEKEMIGFFSVQEGIAFTCPHPELEHEIANMVKQRKIYTVDGIIVLEQYQNQGIASELIRRMKEALKQKDAELVLIEMWIYPDNTIPAQKPLAEVGNVVYQKKVPMFYQNIQTYGIACPVCGKQCQCGALIQLMELRSAEWRRKRLD